MRLRDDTERQDTIQQVLLDQYGHQMRPELLGDLLDRFGGLEAVIVEAAVCRHVMDARPDSSGGAIGRWPPKAADIAYQIEQEEGERRRRQQEEEQRRMSRESDAHYVRATRTGEWMAEVRRAGEIKRMLAYRLELDLREPAHMRVVMEVLKAVTGDTGLREVTDDQALHAAERVMSTAASLEVAA